MKMAVATVGDTLRGPGHADLATEGGTFTYIFCNLCVVRFRISWVLPSDVVVAAATPPCDNDSCCTRCVQF